MRTTKTPHGQCPTCGTRLTGTTDITPENARPKPGDLSVCVYCGAILTFTATMTLRLLSAAEARDCDPDVIATVRRFSAAVRRDRVSHQ